MVIVGDFHIMSNVSNVTEYADLLNEYIYYRIYNLMWFLKTYRPVINLLSLETPTPSWNICCWVYFLLDFFFFFLFKQQLVLIKVITDYEKKNKDVKLVPIDFNE